MILSVAIDKQRILSTMETKNDVNTMMSPQYLKKRNDAVTEMLLDNAKYYYEIGRLSIAESYANRLVSHLKRMQK